MTTLSPPPYTRGGNERASLSFTDGLVSATPHHCSRHVLLLPCLWCDCTCTIRLVAVLLVQCHKLLCVASSLTCTWQHRTLALQNVVIMLTAMQQASRYTNCPAPTCARISFPHPAAHTKHMHVQLRQPRHNASELLCFTVCHTVWLIGQPLVRWCQCW
jgi:hypothetical protein